MDPSDENISLTRILERRARTLARLPSEEITSAESLQLLTFPLGDERYGVYIDLVQDVRPLSQQNWSLVPCTPNFIVGAINIRGRIYSLMDVAHFTGLPSRSFTETTHVLLLRSRDHDMEDAMELSILADDIPQVVNIPFSAVESASVTLSTRMQEYVRGVTKDMLIILDLARLLSDPGIIVHQEV
ncbi:MAG: chemotaxis protein CheW [Anaerolineales bacterium]|nr:chemotaxis protein CheW [Chloroflexota bacterium]MBL6982373.1 chemotaxis protein CheW [Anaerolineales bacterium]